MPKMIDWKWMPMSMVQSVRYCICCWFVQDELWSNCVCITHHWGNKRRRNDIANWPPKLEHEYTKKKEPNSKMFKHLKMRTWNFPAAKTVKRWCSPFRSTAAIGSYDRETLKHLEFQKSSDRRCRCRRYRCTYLILYQFCAHCTAVHCIA